MNTCKKCGTEIDEGLVFCQKCLEGYAISSESTQKKSNTGKIIGAIVGVFLLAAVVIVGLLSYQTSNKEEYLKVVNVMTDGLYLQASEAEKCGSLIIKVWNNTIFEKSDPETDKYTKLNKPRAKYYGSYYAGSSYFNEDFNTSIENLFNDNSFKAQLETIRVFSINTGLNKEPPKGCESLDNAYYQFAANCNVLYNMVLSPSGTLQSYSEEFHTALTNVANSYNTLKMELNRVS